MFLRNDTVKLNVGGVELGGGSRISVQSMTNTDTRDAQSTIEQIKKLEEVGCDIVRVAVPDMQAAESILKIKRNISIPLVADIHFDYKLALECIKNGVDKIRINPGNIGNRENTAAVVKAAKETGRIITVEEHNVIGGLGDAVCEVTSAECPVPVRRIGVYDQFGYSGPAKELLDIFGLTAPNIKKVILEELDKK